MLVDEHAQIFMNHLFGSRIITRLHNLSLPGCKAVLNGLFLRGLKEGYIRKREFEIFHLTPKKNPTGYFRFPISAFRLAIWSRSSGDRASDFKYPSTRKALAGKRSLCRETEPAEWTSLYRGNLLWLWITISFVRPVAKMAIPRKPVKGGKALLARVRPEGSVETIRGAPEMAKR